MSERTPDAGHGIARQVAPGLRRVLAPNPGPMTHEGTNTYLIGTREVAVIDPGPASSAHLDAILAAVGGGRVTDIFVTHAHLDHSALAPALAARTAAPVRAFGVAGAGRRPVMARLAAAGLCAGGVDAAFVPDIALADGEKVARAEWEITALWTPGHMGNHLAFAWAGGAFSGDLVMGWSTSVIAPPDGDAAAFRAGCARLADAGPSVLWPGHGAPVGDPAGRIAELAAHRAARERQVLVAMAGGPADAATLARLIYKAVPDPLLPAAAANVHAHLVDLWERGAVVGNVDDGVSAVFARANPP